MRRTAANLAARLRFTRGAAIDGLDPHDLHELRLQADRLRTENFRTVAVGRLL